jgi:hypothetical protein
MLSWKVSFKNLIIITYHEKVFHYHTSITLQLHENVTSVINKLFFNF